MKIVIFLSTIEIPIKIGYFRSIREFFANERSAREFNPWPSFRMQIEHKKQDFF